MINNKLIEICAGSIEDCATADLFPVDRIELNSAIELGGLTPSVGTLIHAKQVTKLPLCCMVRPRTAGFVYTQHQFESMLFDAELLLENGADGIVFGFLNEDTTIDVQRTKQMADLIKSYGKEVVFHKAFDKTPDKIKACETLIECGVDRILTSGGENYPHIDFETQKQLMTDGLLDSMAVVAIIAAIEDMFDVAVTMEYIQPEYFESAEAMWEMIEELQ